MIRYVAILLLFLSGIGGYTIDKLGQDLCINELLLLELLLILKS